MARFMLFWLFLSCFTVVALTGLTFMLTRTVRVRRGRQDSERLEEGQRMLSRLQEAFNNDRLVNLTSHGAN